MERAKSKLTKEELYRQIAGESRRAPPFLPKKEAKASKAKDGSV